LTHGAFLLSGFEPLKTNFTHFWIYRIVKVFTFPLESNLNIDKNRSTSSVGGFWEFVPPQSGNMFRELSAVDNRSIMGYV